MDGKFGFVVYIDILGTTEGHYDYETRFQDFRNAIADTFDPTFWGDLGGILGGPQSLEIRGLSDSVFLILQISEDIPSSPINYRELNYELVEQFFASLVSLQGRCLEEENPLRGGVTIGITKVEPRSQIIDFIGGIAISDAVRIEEDLKMCGIAFAPKSMLELELHEVFDRYTARLKHKGFIRQFDVPTVHGLVKSYCLSWPRGFDLNEICTRFNTYMPRDRSDEHPRRDFKKAAKYFATARVLNRECRVQEGDQ